MKNVIKLSLILFIAVLCGAWTTKSKTTTATKKVALVTKKMTLSTKKVASAAKRYDVSLSFSNGTYYDAKVSVSNSSGYYSYVNASQHSNVSLSVPQGTYNVMVEVFAPYDTPYHTYNYNFYCGSASKYGSTMAYFENVVVDYSLSVYVN